MFNRYLLTPILVALISLALVVICHQTTGSVSKAIANNFSHPLAMTPSSPQDVLNQKLQKLLDNQVAQGVPGVTMYIKKADGWTWSGASGQSNLKEQVAIKESDRFRIMSITKTFVATVVLQLAQQGKLGKLGLDTTIDQLLPKTIAARIPNQHRIKVRHLLNHRSGLFNYTDNERYERETSSTGTLANVIDWAFGEGSKPPAFAPGERFEYCDTNAIISELIVQYITGHSLAAEIRDRILTPLKLNNTYMERVEKGAVAGSGFVHGYLVKTHNHAPIPQDVTNFGDVVGTGDGGLISNAEDLAKFASGLFHSGTLLNQKFFNQMVNFNNHVGLGVFEENVSCVKVWGHSGLWRGYNTQMYFLPDKNLVAVALANGSNAEPGHLLQEALKLLL
jgi:D-alanyl-D-alanine carboxypeptidase